MHQYSSELLWLRDQQAFVDNRYSRRHLLRFDGGVELAFSSSPQIVAVPMSDASAVDPEEAFVASLSSCHMLWFLDIARRQGFCIDRYSDRAEGLMSRNDSGKYWLSTVTLRPDVLFSGVKLPARSEIEAMHEQAHAECFIANSVRSEVRCEPLYANF